MRSSSLLIWAAVAIAVIFGLGVWPTAYRYDRTVLRGGQEVPTRTHRLTGEAQVLVPGGWKKY